ncbi:hypothetical protein ARMGADRAFT_28902 [Armillaria gallica]|uniref:Uncharacterized protein n=1 Tax=Armillaria gallica TaxID=47427 RepID=A0A2H3EC62_ARMGA|nr:hypothetical protein ARMGADRAFT_28902 [Armillaria gallica]
MAFSERGIEGLVQDSRMWREQRLGAGAGLVTTSSMVWWACRIYLAEAWALSFQQLRLFFAADETQSCNAFRSLPNIRAHRHPIPPSWPHAPLHKAGPFYRLWRQKSKSPAFHSISLFLSSKSFGLRGLSHVRPTVHLGVPFLDSPSLKWPLSVSCVAHTSMDSA